MSDNKYAYHKDKAQTTKRLYGEDIFPQRHAEADKEHYEDWALTHRFYEALHWVSAYVKSKIGSRANLKTHTDLEKAMVAYQHELGLDHAFREYYEDLRERSREARYDNPATYEKVDELAFTDRFNEVEETLKAILENPKIKAYISSAVPTV